MDWVAEEKTKISGTFPPMGKKKWTGYVEKDTAGQTNIYAVEPTVYVSESVISSGTQGDSTEGSEQTIVVSVALAFGLIIATGVVLQSVGISNTPVAPEAPYSGPSLSFYIQKFKQYATVEAAAPQLASSVETTPVQAAPEVASSVEVELSSSQPAAAADTELSISTSDFGVQGES